MGGPLLALVATFLVLQVESQQLLTRPTITSSPDTAELGQPLTLTCNPPDGATVSRYRWLKDFIDIDGQEGASIQFSALVATDSGSYRCIYYGSNDAQSDASIAFEFVVGMISAPELSTIPEGPLISTDTSGGNLQLICTSSSGSRQVFRYYLDGVLVYGSTGRYYIGKSDWVSGTYSCTTSDANGNSESEQSEGVTLTFVAPPVITASQENPNIGDSVTLTCQSSTHVDGSIFRWFKDDFVLESEESQSYTLTSITDDDVGEYKCAIYFSENEYEFEGGRSQGWYLIYEVPAAPSLSGESVLDHNHWLSLTCVANSSYSGLEWSNLYFNGDLISVGNGTSGQALFEQRSLYRQEGTYTCTFTNKRGESAHSNDVTVTVAAWTPESGEIPNTNTIYNKGSYAYIRCDPFEDNTHSYSKQEARSYYCSFFLNGQRYLEDTDCRVYLSHYITGMYTCSATSLEGTGPQSPATRINIYDQPVVRPLTTDPPVVGKNYSLQCVTDASEEYIQWNFYVNRTSNTPALSGSSFFELSYNPTSDQRVRCAVKINGSQILGGYYDIRRTSVNAPTNPRVSVSGGNPQSRYYLPPTSVQMNLYCYGTDSKFFYLYQNGDRIATKSSQQSSSNVFNSRNKETFYSCTVNNEYGQAVSDQIIVQAKDAVKVTASSPLATLGQPLTLTCEVKTSGSNIKYTWGIYSAMVPKVDITEHNDLYMKPVYITLFKDERTSGFYRYGQVFSGQTPIRVEGQDLTFDPVSVNDEGLYYCEAEIDGVSVSSYDHYLIMFSSPLAPQIMRQGANDSIVTIRCYISELFVDIKNPFRLYKNGKEVTDVPYTDSVSFWNKFTVYRYYYVNLEDPANVGEYSCTAVNLFAESKHSAKLELSAGEVIEKPVLTTDNMGAALGEDVTFTCQVSDTVPDYKIHWVKDSEHLFQTGRTLTLKNLAVEDDGQYSCSITDESPSNNYYNYYYYYDYGGNGGQSMTRSDSIFLILRRPLQPLLAFHPDVKETIAYTADTYYPVMYMFAEGETIPLKCVTEFPWSSSYRPQPQLLALEDEIVSHILYKDGVEIETSQGAGEFEISGLAVGVYNYTCMASNRVGDSPMSYPLTINVAEAPTINVSPPSPSLGVDITLSCVTVETSDPRDIFWKKNGKIIFQGSEDLTLESAVQRDEGVYTCRHKEGSWFYPNSNDYLLTFGSAATPEIFIFQTTPVKSGDTLTLYCLTASSTSHQATFFFNGNAIMSMENPELDDVGQALFALNISNVMTSNSGDYSCKVENSAAVSDVSNTITVTIIEKVSCQPGFYHTESGRCEACDFGSYQPAAGQTECLPCPDGLYTMAKAVSDVAQCVEVPATRQIYLRLTFEMTYDGALDDEIKMAVRDNLKETVRYLKYFVGAMVQSVGAGESGSNKVVVIASAVCSIDVTTDMYIRLGNEIYTRYYAIHTSVVIGGNSKKIKSCDMFETVADATSSNNFYDIDECTLQPSVCSAVETCINLPGGFGSFDCSCVVGYQRLTEFAVCTDKDECATPGPGLCTGAFEECVNSMGGYYCGCIEGYTRRTPEDECSNFDRSQQSLYPYGTDKGDTSLPTGDDERSNDIYFENGLPFGSEKFTSACITTNGMIKLGPCPYYRYWWWYWSSLSYAFQSRSRVISPLMTDIDTRDGGQIFYQLYKRSTDPTNPVLDRASSDILDNFGVTGYNPTMVLVVTWVEVKIGTWYYYYYRYARNGCVECDFGQSINLCRDGNRKDKWYMSGWDDTVDTSEDAPGVVTFQANIITDGQTTYVIFMYKDQKIYLPYVRYRWISIGYVNDLDYEEFISPKSPLISDLDRVIGNKGRYGTWMAKVGEIFNPDQTCMNFYTDNFKLINDVNFQEAVEDFFECPCTLQQMGRQWRLVFNDPDRSSRECYALSPLITRFYKHTHNKLCCYNRVDRRTLTFITDPKEAGFVTVYNPVAGSETIQESYRQDIVPQKWCCRESSTPKLCALFYKVRPTHGCSNTAIVIFAFAGGDPHFVTLDGKKYTFNGWGEYIMAKISSRNFVMQARTSRATLKNGEASLATVYSAVAAKEEDYAHFQVELSTNKERLIIYANGQDLTTAFYNDPEFSQTINDSIIVDRTDVNGTVRVTAVFPSGVEISASLGVESLDVGVTMTKTLKGLTSGLLGNFNGNPDDDFQLPDGTILRANLTEKEIFEQFGKKWAVTEETSVFTYPAGESAANYSHPDFVPMFRKDIDPAVLQAAEAFCGSKTDDACIFDYVLTQNEKFAGNTKRLEEEGGQTRIDFENNNPTISLETTTDSEGRVEVTQNQAITIHVSSSDLDGDSVNFELVSSPVGVVISSTGEITYRPQLNSSVSISVVAVDSKGGRSPALTIPIVMCTLCSGHGQCDRSETRLAVLENESFQKYACQCRPAWAGAECETDLDACAGNPCSEGQECTDTAAADQDGGSEPYSCGPCPAGTEEVDSRCADIDECSQDNDCSQLCNNTYRSYECSCNPGYRLSHSDRSTCLDINECAEKTHMCQHKCVNSEGSYRCACEQGYTLQDDQRTCVLTLSSSPCASAGCEQVCVLDENNSPQCGCQSFYQISSQDTATCVDVDECASANQPCDQVCTNIMGGYQCSCHPGFRLADDMTTCIPCEDLTYGVGCSETCMCGSRASRCDPVRGCICKEGYTGAACNININECDQPNICGLGQTCHDLDGSYECRCQDGYKLQEDECVDIDECADILTHDCSSFMHQVCRNTQGSYSCDCQRGFYKDINGVCKDIDECASNSHNCQQQCVNTEGSFNCQCYFGYRLHDTDRTKCVLSQDVCKDVSNLICEHGCSVDLDTKQAFCYCNSGYKLNTDKQSCIDINECSDTTLNGCSHKDRCVNTPGGYMCSCPTGFKLDNDQRTCAACSGQTWGVNCTNNCACSTAGTVTCDTQTGCMCKDGVTGRYCDIDIDECQASPSPCQSFETCINTVGSYSCQCPSGHRATSTGGCEAINECAEQADNNCDQECLNTEGGYMCACYTGFTYSDSQGKCVDVNECELGTHKCSQDCTNTPGSYRCLCSEGFELADDGITCTAITPCTTKSCQHGCAVIGGDETCYCPRGKKISESDGFTCEDVDMCQPNPCDQDCEETEDGTGFVCSCSVGHKLDGDGVSCQACDAGKYGIDCVATCDCVTDHTSPEVCNSTDGTCLCLDGWTGDDCSQDVNECTTSASACSDPNSQCINTAGSFLCQCNDGYLKKDGLCQECEANFYGRDCAMGCECNPANSVCNKVTGDCMCNQGWSGPTCETDVDECQQNTHDCGSYTPSATCVNTPGGYRCECPEGYNETSPQMCQDIDECKDPGLNMCEHICTNKDPLYECTCYAGYSVQPDGRCLDEDECLNNPCLSGQPCFNTEGSYMCQCPEGFTQSPDGTCLDIDECSSNPCPSGQSCSNTEGSYECLCPTGYTKNNDDTCVDVDECSNNPCPSGQSCSNTDGSYTCQCPAGYTKTTDNTCDDIDECSSSPCPSGQSCSNTEGSYECQCPTGYTKSNDDTCDDIDECSNSPCPSGQSCSNNEGSYTCQCPAGYTKATDNTCDDINECSNSPCPSGQSCSNTEGSYECQCPAGYTKSNDDTCVDMDECSNSPCPSGQSCSNTEGSYTCQCPAGYTKATDNTCDDIDECSSSACPSGQSCSNTEGSYECQCPTGYTKSNDGTCVDINECSNSPCPSGQSCSNTVGSYTCQCASGYSESTDGTCVDINECENNPCTSGKSCVNTEGSHSCVVTLSILFEIRFPSVQPTDAMLNSGTEENAALVKEITDNISAQLKITIQGFVKFIVRGFRRGSLIAEGEMIIDEESYPNAVGRGVKGLSELDVTDVTVDGTKYSDAQLFVGEGDAMAVASGSDHCEVRKMISPCTDSEVCIMNDQELTECQESDDEDKSEVYIGIGVGVGVLVLVAVVAVISAVCVKMHKKPKKYAAEWDHKEVPHRDPTGRHY